MASRFRHEDREAVPKGWKVRTVKAGAHRVRVAFPPGHRQKGSGRLVSILHPVGENPCGLRSSNPAELMVMGANPPRTRKLESLANNPTYSGRFAHGGKNYVYEYKYAWNKTYFSFDGGKNFHSSRKHAFEEAKKAGQLQEEGTIRQTVSPNPRVEVVHGENPPVEEIVEQFSGTEADYIDVYNEPHMPRGRYAQLGELLNLHIKPVKGGQVQKITFGSGANAPVVVTDTSAKQIYFVAGNQDISSALAAFGDFGAASMDGVLTLGTGRRIDYKARKEHVASPDEDLWKHDHGEENGVLPTVLFDTKNKRLLYEGGDYRIEGPWIRN